MPEETTEQLSFKNPIVAAQAEEAPFIADPIEGHTMPPGKEFIGEKDYINLSDIIEHIKKNKKRVILNIGDSSTSGWDSNIVTINRERLHQKKALLPAFFQYRTYSDCLRELIGHDFIVINAGVPAHTSVQGSIRLERLLNQFNTEDIAIDWVTAYYGNNDSVWDHNREDIDWLNINGETEDKHTSVIVTRVNPSDYTRAIHNIINQCHQRKIKCIMIQPVTPIYWKPGTRVKNEVLARVEQPGFRGVYQLLDEALALWNSCINEPSYSALKEDALRCVRELDYVVPRIKSIHLKALNELMKQTSCPFIQIKVDRTIDDIQYFIDYCHPIEPMNMIIANEIKNTIYSIEKANNYRYTTIESEETNSVEKNECSDELLEIPTDHYTLY